MKPGEYCCSNDSKMDNNSNSISYSSENLYQVKAKKGRAASSYCCSLKWFGLGFFVLGFILIASLTIGLIFHYENKLIEHESRLRSLEEDFGIFYDEFFIDAKSSINLMKSEHEAGQLKFKGANSHKRDRSSMSHSEENGDGEYDDETAEEEDQDDGDVFELKNQSNEADEKEVRKIVFGELKSTETNDLLSRKKRQVTTIGPNVKRSPSGVPILEGVYPTAGAHSYPVEHSTESEGLRIYESLVATGGHGEPKAAEFSESDGSNLKAYHKTSAAWVEHGSPQHRFELKSGDDQDPLYTRSSTVRHSGAAAMQHNVRGHRDHNRETDEHPSVVMRPSRVPSSEHYSYGRRPNYNYPPLRKLGHGDGEVIARVHQEDLTSESENSRPNQALAGAEHGSGVTAFAESRRTKGGYRTSASRENPSTRHRSIHQRRQNQRRRDDDETAEVEELSIVKAQAWAEGPKTIAAHFVGDPSNYSVSHPHYEGNGKLRNANGIFSSWKASDWMSQSDTKAFFELSPSTGVLTIKKDGLYYVYAQIHYLDVHDSNGFLVQVNSAPFLQCTTTSTSPNGAVKSNTCFTAGINYFKSNDQLTIRDIETNRFSIIRPEKTFFGLMKIGDSPTITK